MYHKPKTLEEARKKRYGQWAGFPRGYAFQEGRCAAEVGDMPHYHQCRAEAVAGPDNLYCRRHAKMLAKREVKHD